MTITLRSSALNLAACVVLTAAGGCTHEGQDSMGWARAALERNAQVEVVATDPQSHSFTVRVKDSGEVRVVRADQLVAGLPGGTLAPATQPAAAAEPAATPMAAAAPAPAEAETEPAQYGEAARPSPAAEVHPDAGGGKVLKSGPGYSIQAAGAAPAAPRAAENQVIQSGPGYSIRGGAASPPVAARTRDATVTSAALERRHEPIVCQGDRMLHIDNRNLQFDGDAVSAQDGCEIHITNSHITATGVGVQARAANVHIDNSLIEGDGGSLDLSDGAQAYAASSHFRGLSRRMDTASVHDLGGNIWN
ncbi:MAG: hypothetical protein JSR36_12010 [Proteobacteria bacterium]|nr:hypothetical protein [Pseudomonadota bacterium]